MTTPDQEAEAVRVYRRTLGEVAASQAVAAAEDVLCDAWIEELERFRTAVLDAGAFAGPDGTDVLAALDEELEHVCLVGIERTRRGREDLARLRAAWLAAYGRTGD